MSMPARSRTFLAVAVVGGALLAWLALAALRADPASTYHAFKVWHFNVCGNKCHTGNDTADDSTDPVRAIYNSLTSGDPPPKAASLNELCRNQYDKLMSLLPDTWHGEFTVAKSPGDSDTDSLCFQDGSEHNYGNAILVRTTIAAGSRIEEPLPHAKSETRKIVCVTGEFDVHIRFCSTHIAPLDTWSTDAHAKQDDQIAKVTNIVNGFTRPTVLMGDFNTDPPSDKLDRLYDSGKFDGGATGKFEEIDQDTPSYGNTNPPCRCGASTHSSGRKIDYVFFNDGDWQHGSGFVTDTVTKSDHKILRGEITLVH